jgi:spore germination protein KB
MLIFPLGVVIIIGSMTIASNYSEHIQEGTVTIPYLLHLPFQMIIPVILLIIAFVKGLKNRK